MPEKLEAPEVQEVKVQRPKRAKLSAEESLKRMEAFLRVAGSVPKP